MNQHNYFIQMCISASMRGTCDRLKVGAIIVKDNKIISTGYNGAPKACDECNISSHIIYHNNCVRTVHAELNALLQCADTDQCVLYTTHKPCYNCMKALINSNIKKVYFKHNYKDDYQYLFEDKFEVLECVE